MAERIVPTLSLAVAVANNGVIGNAGDLPWRMVDDLRRFKQLTMGHALIMGRKTYESIGRPLPGRLTMVLTTNRHYKVAYPEVCIVHSLNDAIAKALNSGMKTEEVFVVGGAEVYRLALPIASRIYRTRISACPTGDAYFPELTNDEWLDAESKEYPADSRNEFSCTWEVLERRTAQLLSR